MKYEEALKKIWDERKSKKYKISNKESLLNYRFSYGYVGAINFDNLAIWYVDDSIQNGNNQFPLPLFLLKSDKWELSNPRDLEPDDLFYGVDEEEE